MRRARLAIVAATLLWSLGALAQLRPMAMMGDAHLQHIAFQPNRVFQLATAPGYQITVVLAPDEQVQTVALGDSGGWSVSASKSGDHLFVKLGQGGAATNMTVVTNVRMYAFDLVPMSGPSETMAYTVQFDYPGNAPQAPSAQAFKMVGRYKLSGVHTLYPAGIGDDGQRTVIEWPKDADLPAVYAIDAQGRETLTNGMMRNGLMVIDSVAPQLVFRIDGKVARAKRLPTGATG